MWCTTWNAWLEEIMKLQVPYWGCLSGIYVQSSCIWQGRLSHFIETYSLMKGSSMFHILRNWWTSQFWWTISSLPSVMQLLHILRLYSGKGYCKTQNNGRTEDWNIGIKLHNVLPLLMTMTCWELMQGRFIHFCNISQSHTLQSLLSILQYVSYSPTMQTQVVLGLHPHDHWAVAKALLCAGSTFLVGAYYTRIYCIIYSIIQFSIFQYPQW